MNTNQWIKDNSILVAVVGAIVLIFLFFWWNEKSGDSNQVNSTWLEAPTETSTEALVETTVAIDPSTSTTAPASSAPAAGNIEWCAQINQLSGGHLPHLLNLGTNTAQGGQNWFSSRTAAGTEDWGILSDGTYFIKKSIADKAAAQLGTSITSFQVKTSENNWSVPKPGVLGTVAGQPAWIFK